MELVIYSVAYPQAHSCPLLNTLPVSPPVPLTPLKSLQGRQSHWCRCLIASGYGDPSVSGRCAGALARLYYLLKPLGRNPPSGPHMNALAVIGRSWALGTKIVYKKKLTR